MPVTHASGSQPICGIVAGERHQNILALELVGHDERQTFSAGLVDDGQDAKFAAVMCAFFGEVECRYMPWILGPQKPIRMGARPIPIGKLPIIL